MTKYLLRFNKKGNMRFISHLDLGRLFSRSIKKSEIDVAYSNGFNPHERTNIVQPLSLGIESDSEYFEITCNTDYSVNEVLTGLNECMPSGIEFFDGRIIDMEAGNYSNKCAAAKYIARLNLPAAETSVINIDDFARKDCIMVKKRDKKTKTYVPKDVTSFVYSLKDISDSSGFCIEMILRCAPNETLNPYNLLAAICLEYGVEYSQGKARVTRTDILSEGPDGFVSLFEI